MGMRDVRIWGLDTQAGAYIWAIKYSVMQTAASPTLKLQVELSVSDLIALFDRLPARQKLEVFENLRMKAFREGWLRLSKEIPQAGFSEAEIMQEIKAVRRSRHAKNG